MTSFFIATGSSYFPDIFHEYISQLFKINAAFPVASYFFQTISGIA